MITIKAYAKDHKQLWMDKSKRVPHLVTYEEYRLEQITRRLRKTAFIIDPDTTLLTSKQHVAYFRISFNGIVRKIYITKYGREVGIRNYQTRRFEDINNVSILGHAVIHKGPWINIPNPNSIDVAEGEGNPYSPRKMIFNNLPDGFDRHGDEANLILRAMRGMKKNRWLVHNEITDDWQELVGLSREKLIDRLLQMATEMKLNVDSI